MRPPRNQWPSTDGSRGVLMFAQLMNEMLSPTTFESFRVYTLDTVSRLDEGLSLIDDVQRNRIPRAALDSVFNELNWSLDKDPVVRSLARPEVEVLKEIMKGDQLPLQEVSAHLTMVSRLIGPMYRTNLEEKLLSTFSENNRRIELRQVCGFYCSYLLNLGYTRPHITNIINSVFFAADLQRVGAPTLRRFFRMFDGRRKRFIVYTGISADFGRFLRDLGFEIENHSRIGTIASSVVNSNVNSNNLTFVLVSNIEPPFAK